MINIKFKKLSKDAEIPKYAYAGDIGLDVKSTDIQYDYVTDTYIYYTGLACETKKNIGIFGMLRSSNYKTDCYLTNGVGLIDSASYRGEIQFRYKNRTSMKTRIELEALRKWSSMSFFKKLFTSYSQVYDKVKDDCLTNALDFAPYKVGDRCGQFVILEFPQLAIKSAKKLSETTRDKNGHGSTGV